MKSPVHSPRSRATYPLAAVLAAVIAPALATLLAIAAPAALITLAASTASGAEESKAKSTEFQKVRRPNAVRVEEEYDVTGLTLPIGEIHELLPRDAIASLTDPELESVADAVWMGLADRVIDVTISGESVAVPFRILNFHEIANMTVGGEPIAATY